MLRKKVREKNPVADDIAVDTFFDQYNIDLGDFTFDRDELYAR